MTVQVSYDFKLALSSLSVCDRLLGVMPIVNNGPYFGPRPLVYSDISPLDQLDIATTTGRAPMVLAALEVKHFGLSKRDLSSFSRAPAPVGLIRQLGCYRSCMWDNGVSVPSLKDSPEFRYQGV